jgi:signal transduction histidine kinase/ligand-binding sensor domain-containing protein
MGEVIGIAPTWRYTGETAKTRIPGLACVPRSTAQSGCRRTKDAKGIFIVMWIEPLHTCLARLKRYITIAVAGMASITVANNALAQRIAGQEAGFTHSVWPRNSSVPDYISSIAQTPDNWLWLSSKGDLYRFDGVTAERYDVAQADGTSLAALFATKAGDLWLGYQSGLTIMLPAQDFTHPRVLKAVASNPIQFQEDLDGHIWLRTTTGLYETSADKREWNRVDQKMDIDAHHFYAIAVDTEGTLWTLTDQGVYSLRRDGSHFEQSPELSKAMEWPGLNLESPEYRHYVIRYGNFYLLDLLAMAGKRVLPVTFGAHSGAAFDSDSNVWIFTVDGIHKHAKLSASDLEKLAQDHDLDQDAGNWTKMSSGRPLTIMEDRQHNIWLGTVSGLEKFQPSLVTTINLPAGIFNYAMLAGNDGSIWFGNAVAYHYFRWWHVDRDAVPVEGYDKDTTSTYRDTDGSVLLGSGDGYIERFVDGTFSPVDPLPPGAANGNDVLAMARDGQQRLWVSIAGQPVRAWNGSRWLENGGFSELPKQTAVTMVTDTKGRLWISYPHELCIIDGEHAFHYSRADGMDITNVRTMVTDGLSLLAGENGLLVFDGNHFHHILADDQTALTFINGMVRLKDGTLWLNGHRGAVRITAEELKRAINDPGYKVSLRIFGDEEGMPGVAQLVRPLPTLIEGSDGRLWFADTEGLAWLDPAKIPVSHTPPAVYIRSIAAGTHSYRPDQLRPLDAGTSQLEIDYSAIGLADATKARFRYQLAGIDHGWRDVGTRRQAFYTNLGPGTYQFRVIASNEDGLWSSNGASVSISIAPYFYQTQWFMLLCVVLAAGLLWLAYLYRLHLVTRRLHQRLEERHGERDRIARELHDTFLQTVHALMLKIHAASEKLPDGEPRDNIAEALDLADLAIAEGRGRVHALRSSSICQPDLAAAFEKLAEEYRGNGYPAVSVSTAGARKLADPLIIDELYASGREAIINAINHSGAKSISVVVSHDQQGIRIEVSDDGSGIDPQVILDGGKPGHWGLRGIKERMDRMGGELRIISAAMNGTRIILFVDASRAYRHRLHD